MARWTRVILPDTLRPKIILIVGPSYSAASREPAPCCCCCCRPGRLEVLIARISSPFVHQRSLVFTFLCG